MATKRILVIATNAREYEKVGMRTGLWLGELTHFYDYALEQGYELEIASPAGGFVPLDPESLAHDVLGELGTEQRYHDREYMDLLENTKRASEVNVEDYDAIYFTGGHGVMFDFRDPNLAALTARFYDSGRIVSAVCHGPAGLLDVTLQDGDALVKDKNVTGFSWPEEEAAQRADAVPFSLQDELKNRGGNYSIAKKPFDSHVVTDGRLITGQNPGSARAVAEAVVAALQAQWRRPSEGDPVTSTGGISPGAAARVLVVVSAADRIPLRNGESAPTGTYLGELVEPTDAMLESGFDLSFATPGGKVPTIDGTSCSLMYFGLSRQRRDAALASLSRLLGLGLGTPADLAEIAHDEQQLSSFDAVFVPGGHAPLVDLLHRDAFVDDSPNEHFGALMQHFHDSGRTTALICHAPAALAAAPASTGGGSTPATG